MRVFSIKFVAADDEEDRFSSKILLGLENIDDDLGKRDILIVKISSDNDISELGVRELPAIIFFDDQVPTVFQGQ